MFEKNYYSLVASLREYALDADTKGFDAKEIVAEILEELSVKDARAVRLMYAYYDCENLIARRASRQAYNPLGNIAADELDDELSSPKRVSEPMARVIRAYADPESEWAEGLDMNESFEKALLSAYYQTCQKSESRFMREWAEFDRTLRNVSAAAVARSLARPIESVTVGDGDVVEQLQRSSAADFGLRGDVAYIDAVIVAVNDEQNFLEKEHKIDMIRWEQSIEIATFDYFNVNAILSYLARINIVARWSLLDVKRGREMLQRILAELDGKDLVNKQ